MLKLPKSQKKKKTKTTSKKKKDVKKVIDPEQQKLKDKAKKAWALMKAAEEKEKEYVIVNFNFDIVRKLGENEEYEEERYIQLPKIDEFGDEIEGDIDYGEDIPENEEPIVGDIS